MDGLYPISSNSSPKIRCFSRVYMQVYYGTCLGKCHKSDHLFVVVRYHEKAMEDVENFTEKLRRILTSIGKVSQSIVWEQYMVKKIVCRLYKCFNLGFH